MASDPDNLCSNCGIRYGYHTTDCPVFLREQEAVGRTAPDLDLDNLARAVVEICAGVAFDFFAHCHNDPRAAWASDTIAKRLRSPSTLTAVKEALKGREERASFIDWRSCGKCDNRWRCYNHGPACPTPPQKD